MSPNQEVPSADSLVVTVSRHGCRQLSSRCLQAALSYSRLTLERALQTQAINLGQCSAEVNRARNQECGGSADATVSRRDDDSDEQTDGDSTQPAMTADHSSPADEEPRTAATPPEAAAAAPRSSRPCRTQHTPHSLSSAHSSSPDSACCRHAQRLQCRPHSSPLHLHIAPACPSLHRRLHPG